MVGWRTEKKQMRRAQSIFAMLVLLAMPLALLADAGRGMPGACNRYCCMPHGRHATSAVETSSAKAADGMSCHHSAPAKSAKCTMQPNGRLADFGAFAPLPPTKPELRVALIGPKSSRQHTARLSESLSAGFLSEPFDPPRA